jgi:prolyl oligopeptidase
MFGASGTEDGRFIVMTASKDTARSNLFHVADVEDPHNKEVLKTKDWTSLKWEKIIDEWGTYWSDIGNDGTKFYLYTNVDGASNYKIVTYDLAKPEEGFKDLIAHDPKSPLTSAHIAAQDQLILTYSVDVKGTSPKALYRFIASLTSPFVSFPLFLSFRLFSPFASTFADALYLHSLSDGKRVRRLASDKLGSIDGLAGKRSQNEFWFSMSSFVSPGTVYRFDFEDDAAKGKKSGEEKVYREASVEGIKADDFISEQVFYESKDGTRVPMFVTRPKECVFSFSCFLSSADRWFSFAAFPRTELLPQSSTGSVSISPPLPPVTNASSHSYGGFSAAITPFFSPSLMTWIKHYKGVLAIANIRGGDEFGENWHLDGTKEKKQNVFDDFQYAAKYLQSEGFAAKDKVAISGGSNGGASFSVQLDGNEEGELDGS